MQRIKGQCSCGAVQFEFNADELKAYQCHCSVCRKATGSAYSTTLMAAADGFAWLCGEESISSYSRDNGYRLNFCSCCGSPVPNRFRELSLFSVPVGALDNAPEIDVVVQLFLDSRARWETAELAGERYGEMPSLEQMFEHLRTP